MRTLIIVSVVFLLAGCSEKSRPSATPLPDDSRVSQKTSAPNPATKFRFGTISGRVVYSGDVVPELAPLVKKGMAAKDPNVCACGADIPNESLIINPANRGVANVFVYLKEKPRHIHPSLVNPSEKLEITIEHCRYHPRAAVVRTGQIINVHNKDQIAHNTHTFRDMNDPFGALIPANDRSSTDWKIKPFTKSTPEPVSMRCDFHSYMLTYILPVDHPYAVVADENGHFEIPKVPYGNHKLVVWHELAAPRRLLDPDRRIRVDSPRIELDDTKYKPSQLMYDVGTDRDK